MSDALLLGIGRWIGLGGFGLLVLSGVGGALLASRTVPKSGFLKGRTFQYHRLLSLVGAGLLLLHPIPMVLAKSTTGMRLVNVFVPFTAPKQGFVIGLGVIAAYVLLVVTVSSIYMNRINRSLWRFLHYGTYLVFGLGLAHGVFISGEFKAGESLEFDEPEKLLLLGLALVVVLFPVWRFYFLAKSKRTTAE